MEGRANWTTMIKMWTRLAPPGGRHQQLRLLIDSPIEWRWNVDDGDSNRLVRTLHRDWGRRSPTVDAVSGWHRPTAGETVGRSARGVISTAAFHRLMDRVTSWPTKNCIRRLTRQSWGMTSGDGAVNCKRDDQPIECLQEDLSIRCNAVVITVYEYMIYAPLLVRARSFNYAPSLNNCSEVCNHGDWLRELR